MSALKKKTYSEILRPSAAKIKLRVAYSKPPEVAVGGVISGFSAFLSPVLLYIAGSAVAAQMKVGALDFTGRLQWLIDYFSVRVSHSQGIDAIMVNLLVLAVFFSISGIIAAFVYRIAVVREDSDSFFQRKPRFPYEFLPFFCILLFNHFETGGQVLLGIIVCILIAAIWRFYYGRLLSMISSVDVGKIVPDMEL